MPKWIFQKISGDQQGECQPAAASNVYAPLFALTEFWFKVCSELRPLKLGFYDPLKNLQPLKKKVVHFA